MLSENAKINSGSPSFSKWMTADSLFVIFFILLALKILPGQYGNRLMGAGVLILAGLLLSWRLLGFYGSPTKWFKPIWRWFKDNRLTAFSWVLFLGGLLVSCLLAVFSTQQSEQNGVDEWIVIDKKPKGALIRTVYDEQLKKHVMEFSGAVRNDSYRMRNLLYRTRNDSKPLIFEWRMKFKHPFSISVRMETSQGQRILLYTPAEKSRLIIGKKRKVVHHGLGSIVTNGEWQTVVRDLQADLREGDPDVTIKKVVDFRIRGNGRVDDRRLSEEFGWPWKKRQLPLTLLVSALASYAFLFLIYWLFRLSHGDGGYLWVLLLMIVVNAIPFWQKFDYESISLFLNYTVAADVLDQKKISSVLRTVTIYSPLAAVMSIFFWGRFLMKKSRGIYRHAELVMAALAMGGALLAGSRTGILSLLMGFVALVFYVPARRKWWILYAALIAVVVMHLFALWYPYLGKKVGAVLPYVNKLQHHEPTTLNDFVPDLTAGYSGKKVNRWIRIKESFALWQANPWFGIGLGQYNMVPGHNWIHNVHNLFLNILCEGGILVFVAWLYLAGRFVWERRRSWLTAVVVSIFVVSCFSNLFDHSMPWVLTCSWIFSREGDCFS